MEKKPFFKKVMRGLNVAFNPFSTSKSPLQYRRELLNLSGNTTQAAATDGESFQYTQVSFQFSENAAEDIKIRTEKINQLRKLCAITLVFLSAILTVSLISLAAAINKPSVISVFQTLVCFSCSITFYTLAAKYSFLADGLLNRGFQANVLQYIREQGIFFPRLAAVTEEEVMKGVNHEKQ